MLKHITSTLKFLSKSMESEDIAGQLVISMQSQDPPNLLVAVPLNQFLTTVVVIYHQPQGFHGLLQDLGRSENFRELP